MFLGFYGLSMVPVKPLSELGFSGMIGAVIAIVCAYLIYPVTLRFIDLKVPQNHLVNKTKFTVDKPRYLSTFIILSISVLLGLGVFRLNTGPSIINYFANGSEVRKGMITLDDNGGSSTLRLVVSHPRLVFLDNDEAFHAMDSLHRELANHKDVGAVVSLPLLMKEAKSGFWSNLLPWGLLVDLLSADHFQNVADRFMTRDRKQALFILRMKESEHNKPRAEIIKDIERIVANYGFKLEHRGGPYSLQAQLAQLTKTSLYEGLLWLFASFFMAALLFSRSVRNSFAMLVVVVLIAFVVIGSICLKSAIGLISFPAIFISLLLAIDTLIRMVSVRQHATLGNQLNPVLASCLIISLSSISLCFSDFVPMQNLGLSLIIAMVLTALTVLIVFPTIYQRSNKS